MHRPHAERRGRNGDPLQHTVDELRRLDLTAEARIRELRGEGIDAGIETRVSHAQGLARKAPRLKIE